MLIREMAALVQYLCLQRQSQALHRVKDMGPPKQPTLKISGQHTSYAHQQKTVQFTKSMFLSDMIMTAVSSRNCYVEIVQDQMLTGIGCLR